LGLFSKTMRKVKDEWRDPTRRNPDMESVSLRALASKQSRCGNREVHLARLFLEFRIISGFRYKIDR